MLPTSAPAGKTVPATAILNHNPGRIRRSASVRWPGQVAEQLGDQPLVIFTAPEWGLRAIARTLLAYERRGATTIGALLRRWAADRDAHPDPYVETVRVMMGRPAWTHVEMRDAVTMRAMLRALVVSENGIQPYDEATLNIAMDLAGIDVPGFGPCPEEG